MISRIKYALYYNGDLAGVSNNFIHEKSEKILVRDFSIHMKGKILCPSCLGRLAKSPAEKNYFSNGRAACFFHIKGERLDCNLRSKPKQGKLYDTEEEANRAIENKELVIVSSFLKEQPDSLNVESGEYEGSAVEDRNGPLSAVPIGRHNGQVLNLPSKIKTIRGICTNFEENLIKYFFLPGFQYAVQLQDILINVDVVDSEDEIPKLYYGKVISSKNMGMHSYNYRMTYFEYTRDLKRRESVDFCLKLKSSFQEEKGISDDSTGRIILMFGKVTASGLGLCIEDLGWGELSLLPKKYESLLP
ncbi:hypothetical protein [Cobetia sp. QF-1]|uniref:hypothetical protein n=1 Tax=Cobetia sp. QF-1 TaxID=1969833 RepID=UPI00112FED4C|nr:hypothetical protein [Cobetia sp. QF-1]